MAIRTELHTLLVELLGNENAYFQPPSNIQLKYPCIIYNRSYIDPKFADNIVYGTKKRYSVTVIDQDPDSPIPDKIGSLPLCRFDRHFVADNLNHDVFNIYF